jgi:hypothetical protein
MELEAEVLKDGIYDVSDCEFLAMQGEHQHLFRMLDEDWQKVVEEFVEKFPDYVIASAYETYQTILLSKKPPLVNLETHGTEFHHGCTAIIDVPKPMKILIVAEND